jgi:hypothetical protein
LRCTLDLLAGPSHFAGDNGDRFARGGEAVIPCFERNMGSPHKQIRERARVLMTDRMDELRANRVAPQRNPLPQLRRILSERPHPRPVAPVCVDEIRRDRRITDLV